MRSVAPGLRPHKMAPHKTTGKTNAMLTFTQPAVRPIRSTVHSVRRQAALDSQIHPAAPICQHPFAPPHLPPLGHNGRARLRRDSLLLLLTELLPRA